MRKLQRILGVIGHSRLWRAIEGSWATPFVITIIALIIVLSCGRKGEIAAAVIREPSHYGEGVADTKETKDPPIQLGIPTHPESWQKKPPCDADTGEVAIFGACYVELKKVPPCGRTRYHEGSCYRPVVEETKPKQRDPSSIHP